METIPEKKRCSGLCKMHLVGMFKEGRKTCVKCAEKRRRQKQNNCEYIIGTPEKKTIKTKKKQEREQTKILPEK